MDLTTTSGGSRRAFLVGSTLSLMEPRLSWPKLEAGDDGLCRVLADLEDDGPAVGMVICVRRRDPVYVLRGLADMDAKRSPSMSTPFDLASLSKQFTAAALALEILADRLSLDLPVRAVMPELPGFMDPITLAHLAWMTSGLTEYFRLPSPRGGWASEDRFRVEDALAAVIGSGRLEFEPGSRWSYSNIDYQILALAVSRSSGLTFADHLKRNLFDPLGMTNSWVDCPLKDSPHRAVAYVPDGSNAWRPAPRLSPHYGGSGVFSSLEDLARWNRAVYERDDLRPGLRDLLLRRRRFQHPKDNDGLGVVHGTQGTRRSLWYEGGDYGVGTFMLRLPEPGWTVFCLAARADADVRRRCVEAVTLLASAGDR